MAVQEQLIIQARAETSQAVAGMQTLSKSTDDLTKAQTSLAGAQQQQQTTAQGAGAATQALGDAAGAASKGLGNAAKESKALGDALNSLGDAAGKESEAVDKGTRTRKQSTSSVREAERAAAALIRQQRESELHAIKVAEAQERVATQAAKTSVEEQRLADATEKSALRRAAAEEKAKASSEGAATATEAVGVKSELSAIKMRTSAMMVMEAAGRINTAVGQQGPQAWGNYSAGIGGAIFAFESFLPAAGPIGVALIGIGSALEIGASLWKAYGKATNEAKEASAAAAAKIRDDMAGILSGTVEAQRAALIEKRGQIQNQALQEYAEFVLAEKGLTEERVTTLMQTGERYGGIITGTDEYKQLTRQMGEASNYAELLEQTIAELGSTSEGVGAALNHMSVAGGTAEEAIAILDQQMRALEPVQRSVTDSTNADTHSLHTNTSARRENTEAMRDAEQAARRMAQVVQRTGFGIAEQIKQETDAAKEAAQNLAHMVAGRGGDVAQGVDEARKERDAKRELMRKKAMYAEEAALEKKLNDQRARDANLAETTNRAVAQSFAAIGEAIGNSIAGDGESAIDVTKHIVANVAQMYGQLYLLQGARDVMGENPALGAVELASGTALIALSASLGGSSASAGGGSANAGASGTGSEAGPVQQTEAPSGTFGYFSNTGDRQQPGIVVISKDAGSTRFALRQLQMTEARGGSGF